MRRRASLFACGVVLALGCSSPAPSARGSSTAPPPVREELPSPVLPPSSEAPLTPEEAEAIPLADACIRFGSSLRALFAASANALGGEAPAPRATASTLARTRAELQGLPGSERACALCAVLSTCGEGSELGAAADARTLIASAIALEGGSPEEPAPDDPLPPEGGATIGALAARWCGRCARPDAPR